MSATLISIAVIVALFFVIIAQRRLLCCQREALEQCREGF